MPGEINRYPSGLLSAFDLKTQGETPRYLAPTVQVTFDGMPYYICDKERAFSAVQLAYAGATGFVGSCIVTVPDDEIWYVRHFGCNLGNIVAANGYGVGPGLLSASRLDGSFYLGLVGKPIRGVSIANEQFYVCADNPFWCFPGDALGPILTARQTVNVDLSIRGLYVPFKR